MTFVNAFIYDPATGAILRRQNCADVEVPYLGPNVVIADPATSENWSDLTHCVIDGALTERVPMEPHANKTTILSDGTDEAIISDLPPTGSVYLNDEFLADWADSVFVYRTTEAGAHLLRFASPPSLDAEIEITAVEAAA